MSNKYIFKKVYSKNINKEKNYKKILISLEDNNKSISRYVKWTIVPLSVLIILTIIFKDYDKKSIKLENSNTTGNESFYTTRCSKETEININKVSQSEQYRYDADIVEVCNYSGSSVYEELKNLIVPDDLDSVEYFEIYGKRCASDESISKADCIQGEYDKLINYKIYYENKNTNRNIEISFSKDNKPIRDYYFSDEGSKESTINGTSLIINQSGTTYFTEFTYRDINFDIETRGITEEEFLKFLKSIIR